MTLLLLTEFPVITRAAVDSDAPVILSGQVSSPVALA
jgi:hypothetical protein